MTVGDWAGVAAGAAAVAAVIVALFGAQLRLRLMPPRLELTIEEPAGYPSGPATWFHVRVSNPRRWPPVTGVRVFLLKIEAPGRHAWLGEVPMRWRFAQQVGDTLDFGHPWDCDLCAVGDDNRLTLQPAIDWQIPGDLLTQGPPVHLKLTLKARGREVDSDSLTVRLDWDAGRPPELRKEAGGH